MKTCYMCNKELKANESSHIHCCAKNNGINLNKDDLMFNQIEHQTGTSIRDVFFDLYVNKNYTYKNFKKEFDMSSKQVDFMLKYLKIKKRNKNLSKILKADSYKQTCLEKYGTENYNNRDKYKETCLEKYGINNAGGEKEFIKKACKTKLEKYGNVAFAFKNKTHSEKIDIIKQAWAGAKIWRENLTDEEKEKISKEISVRSKNRWAKMSECEKTYFIQKITNFKSKLEQRVYEAIVKLNPKRQYWIGRMSYDFKISKNIILEVNGDYWHANPKKYKEDDIILYPKKGLKKAKSIWEKDRLKKETAEKFGYKVFYLWENEIKKMTDEEILNFVKKII